MNDLHRIVSSDEEQLILVDEQDNELGFQSKAECHSGSGTLHRAFSLFLFNEDGEMLLQQRSSQKRLWPGYWSNSCCSHPRHGESMSDATRRRLDEELNITADLEHVYYFCYQAAFGGAGSENELCHIYLGRVSGNLCANEREIESVRYLSAAALNNELEDSPERFTPWFHLEWRALREDYPEQLKRYAI